MKPSMTLMTLLSATTLLACTDPGGGDDTESVCGFSEPSLLFAHEFTDSVLGYGPAAEVIAQQYATPDGLYFSTSKALYTSGACGEDLAPLPAGDGLWHLHADLAIDCDAGVALRGDGNGELVPAREGVYCDWLITPEGILGTAKVEGGGEGIIPLRLIDFRAPELPIMALSDEPIHPWATHVGPRGVGAIEFSPDRLRTGHFSSPYLMLTQGGQVLHVDRDTWTTTGVMTDVAELFPSPHGEAFGYRPRLADAPADAPPGEFRVHVLATGKEHTLAAADEEPLWGFSPWWSVDGSFAAVTVTVAGQFSDRVLALSTGALALTPPSSRVQRELEGGALWLTADDEAALIQREIYWEPLNQLTRELYIHEKLPAANRRATAEGLEILDFPGWNGSFGTYPGTLFHVPYDGSGPVRLAADIYPWYQRLADGRIATIRPTSEPLEVGDAVDLVTVDDEAGTETIIDTSVIPIGPLLATDGGHESGYFRIIGDLLTYAVRDDAGKRSGVWAVSLPEL